MIGALIRATATFGMAAALMGAVDMPADEDAIAALATRATVELCPQLIAGTLKLNDADTAALNGFNTDKLGERFAFSVGKIPDRVILARGLAVRECTIGLNAGQHPQAFARYQQNLVDAGFTLTMDKPSTAGGVWGYDKAQPDQILVYRVAIIKFEDQSLITASLIKPKKKS